MVLIKVENIEVFNFEGAIRGLRNPMNSWARSDSHSCNWEMSEYCDKCGKLDADNTGVCESDRQFYCIGKNDLDLMKRLFKAGTEHRKYLRQIFVSTDIVAPLYWWKEFDTYKVGTVANSCSTMHKITAKEFTLDDFSHDHLTPDGKDFLLEIINALNDVRAIYIDFDKYVDSEELEKSITSKKDVWWQMIQLLPSSYNQRRTVTMNYENVFTIIKQRSGHKLDEWNEFVEILKSLPYVKDIAGYEE
jgi:hypothetical protein